MKLRKLDINCFVNDYLFTAAWVTCDSDENQEFTRDAKKIAKEDCEQFIEAVKKEFGEEKGHELLTTAGNDLGYLAAHDFFLSRNGHGSDFRDKVAEYGSKEDTIKLAEIAQKLGMVDCYHVRGKKSKLCFN